MVRHRFGQRYTGGAGLTLTLTLTLALTLTLTLILLLLTLTPYLWHRCKPVYRLQKVRPYLVLTLALALTPNS